MALIHAHMFERKSLRYNNLCVMHKKPVMKKEDIFKVMKKGN